MDNLLNELKENSTLLCNSLSDADVYNFFHTVQAPPKSQAPNFFNFSNMRNSIQSPQKSHERSLNSKDSFKSLTDALRSSSNKCDTQILKHRTPEKQQSDSLHLSFLEEFISKRGSNSKTKSQRKSSLSQSDFFANCLGIFGNQANDDPNCCSSEYYYNDQSTEEFLSQVLSSRDDDCENDDIYHHQAFRGTSFGLFEKKPIKYLIQDMLEINKGTLDFGAHLPGKILEETLEIKNNSAKSLVVEVYVTCLNPELQQTEEYVYSIRNNFMYDYSESKQFVANPNSVTSFRIAIKIPGIKLNDQIKGTIRIVAQELDGELTTSLQAQSVFPRVFCPKQLYSDKLKRNVLPVAISREKSQEKKITLKNDSDVPVTLELGFYNPHPEQPSHESSVYPKILTIPAKETASATVLFKPSAAIDNRKFKAIQKVMYGKAKDSSLVYSFVLWVETF